MGGQTFVRERSRGGGRSLRTQKNVFKCPTCPNDISEFLQNVQVNRELMGTIELLQRKIEDDKNSAASEEENAIEDEKDSAASEDEISETVNEKEEDEVEPEPEPEHVITIPTESKDKAAIKNILEEEELAEPVPEQVTAVPIETNDKAAAAIKKVEEEEKVEPEGELNPTESKSVAKRKRGAAAVSPNVRKSPRVTRKCSSSSIEEDGKSGANGKAASKKRGTVGVAQGVRKSPRRVKSGSPSSPLHLRSNGF